MTALDLLATTSLFGVQVSTLLFVVALLLLVGGVAGSVLPVVPGGALTLVGTYVYWWSTGFTDPGVAFVAVATLLALGAIAVDVLGEAAAAGAAGTSKRVAAVAGLVGLALGLFTGPVGILLGIGLTVFGAELYRGSDTEESFRVAVKTVVGIVTTYGIQFLLTSVVLVGFVVVWLT